MGGRRRNLGGMPDAALFNPPYRLIIMFETYRMLGREHEADLERAAGIRRRAGTSARVRPAAASATAARTLTTAFRLALTKLAALAH
jgi:hypothetical protein